MAPKKTNDELISELKALGYASRMVPLQRLHEVEEEIDGRQRKGMFDLEFYQERLTGFDFDIPPAEMKGAKSILIIAMPSTQIGVIFNWNGEERILIMPPTYVGYHTLPARG